MNPLIIERTESTPLVHLDREKNIFRIEGNSYPEDPIAFYDPVIQWIRAYGNMPNAQTEISFNFDYFNSSSHKSIFEIISMLSGLPRSKVLWHFREHDIDMKEIGEEFREASGLDFSFLPIS